MMSPRAEIFKQLLCCSVLLYYMFRRKSLVLICKRYFDSTNEFLALYLVLDQLRVKSTWDYDDI